MIQISPSRLLLILLPVAALALANASCGNSERNYPQGRDVRGHVPPTENPHWPGRGRR